MFRYSFIVACLLSGWLYVASVYQRIKDRLEREVCLEIIRGKIDNGETLKCLANMGKTRFRKTS